MPSESDNRNFKNFIFVIFAIIYICVLIAALYFYKTNCDLAFRIAYGWLLIMFITPIIHHTGPHGISMIMF